MLFMISPLTSLQVTFFLHASPHLTGGPLKWCIMVLILGACCSLLPTVCYCDICFNFQTVHTTISLLPSLFLPPEFWGWWLKAITESNASCYNHLIPKVATADFFCLTQAVCFIHLLNRIAKYTWYTFCHIPFLYTPIFLLLPQRLLALSVPCSIILIHALGTYTLNSFTSTIRTHSWSFNEPLCIPFSCPWPMGKYKSFQFVLASQLHSTSCLYFISLCLIMLKIYTCSVALKHITWPKLFRWTSPTGLKIQNQRPFIFWNSL